MKKYHLVLFSIFLLCIACNSNKKASLLNTKNNQEVVPEIVKTYFIEKDSIQIIPNKTHSIILYLSESPTSSANPTSHCKYVIFDIKLNKVLLQDNYSNSLIKWYDTNSLLLTRFFGITETPLSSSIKYYLINIYTKEVNEINSEIINQQLK